MVLRGEAPAFGYPSHATTIRRAGREIAERALEPAACNEAGNAAFFSEVTIDGGARNGERRAKLIDAQLGIAEALFEVSTHCPAPGCVEIRRVVRGRTASQEIGRASCRERGLDRLGVGFVKEDSDSVRAADMSPVSA